MLLYRFQPSLQRNPTLIFFAKRALLRSRPLSVPSKLLMQLHHRKMVLSATENPEVNVKILKKRLLMPRMNVWEGALKKLAFSQRRFQTVNLSHALTPTLTLTLRRKHLKRFCCHNTDSSLYSLLPTFLAIEVGIRSESRPLRRGQTAHCGSHQRVRTQMSKIK
jgi:hypothetical protein